MRSCSLRSLPSRSRYSVSPCASGSRPLHNGTPAATATHACRTSHDLPALGGALRISVPCGMSPRTAHCTGANDRCISAAPLRTLVATCGNGGGAGSWYTLSSNCARARSIVYARCDLPARGSRSEELTYELQSLLRISYDVLSLKKKH